MLSGQPRAVDALRSADTFVEYVKALLNNFWMDYVSVGLLVATLLSLKLKVRGFSQLLSNDSLPYLSYPELTNTVPSWTVAVLPWAIPCAVFIVAALLKKSNFVETHQLCLSCITAAAATGLCNQIIKIQVGRPRPSFLARCFPDGALAFVDPAAQPLEPLCTQPDPDEVREAYQSFASGHCAYFTTGGIFLTLYFMRKASIFQGNCHTASLVISLVPVAAAGWVGLTRITDYAHHPTDVLGGFIEGLVLGGLFFAQARGVLVREDAWRARAQEIAYRAGVVFEESRPRDPLGPVATNKRGGFLMHDTHAAP